MTPTWMGRFQAFSAARDLAASCATATFDLDSDGMDRRCADTRLSDSRLVEQLVAERLVAEYRLTEPRLAERRLTDSSLTETEQCLADSRQTERRFGPEASSRFRIPAARQDLVSAFGHSANIQLSEAAFASTLSRG